MNVFLPYAVILLILAGAAAPACADGISKDSYGKRIGKTVPRLESKIHPDPAGRALATDAVRPHREIVIDKGGRRIGLAIPKNGGGTNDDLLRLRSGKRVGNQLFNPSGRRVGTIIKK
jgi:hypothetical protein